MTRALLSPLAVAGALAILVSSPASSQSRYTMTAIAMAESGGNSRGQDLRPWTTTHGGNIRSKWSDITLKQGRTNTRMQPTVKAR